MLRLLCAANTKKNKNEKDITEFAKKRSGIMDKILGFT
jgi:hypothetical protein